MLSLKKIVAILAISTASLSVNAAFISSDWLEVGDNKIVLDESTGIEWLDISETIGLNVVDIESNSLFDGFTVGSRVEILDFLDSVVEDERQYDFNVFHRGSDLDTWAIYEVADSSYSMAGFGYGSYHHYKSYGSYNKTNNRGDFGIWLRSDGGKTISSVNNPEINRNNPNAPAHSTVSVPEPSTLGLLALSGLFIAGRKRKVLINR